MPGIFNDEGCNIEPIWPYRYATNRICSADRAFRSLKWPALLRRERLATKQMRFADTATMILDRP